MDGIPPLDIEVLLFGCFNVRQWNHKDVLAPYWRFYWNGGEGAYILAEGKEMPMIPESFFLVPANFRFSTRSASQFPHLYIHFRAGRPYDRVIPRIYSFPMGKIIGQKVKALSGLISQTDDERRFHLLAYSLVYDSLLMLGKSDFKKQARFNSRVEVALAVLDENTSRLVENDELSQETGMTTSALIRLFTRQVGMSPQKYSRKKRIEKASLLLHFSNKRIEEIAQETGFIDRYHFSKVFTKNMGVAPAEFRKRKSD